MTTQFTSETFFFVFRDPKVGGGVPTPHPKPPPVTLHPGRHISKHMPLINTFSFYFTW